MTSSPSRRSNRATAKANAKIGKAIYIKPKATTNLNSNTDSEKSQSAKKSAHYYANNGPMLREKAKVRMRNIRAARATTVQPQAASALNQAETPTQDSQRQKPSISRRSPPSSPLLAELSDLPQLHRRFSGSPHREDLSLDSSPSPESPAYLQRRLSRSPTPDVPPRSRSPSPAHRSRTLDDRCIDPRLRHTHMELDDIALQGVDLDLKFDLDSLPYEFDVDNSDLDIQFDGVNLPHNLEVVDHFDTRDEFKLITHRRRVGEWASRWGHTSGWVQEIKSNYHHLRTEQQKDHFICIVAAHAYQGRIIVGQLGETMNTRLPKKAWHVRELWRNTMELLEPMYRGLAIIDAWMDFIRVISPY